MIVKITLNDKGNPPGKLADAELQLKHTKFLGLADERTTVTDAEGLFSVDMDRGWIFGQGSIVVTGAFEPPTDGR